MHSLKLSRVKKWVLLSLALSMAMPIGAYADGEKGAGKLNARRNALVSKQASLKARLAAAASDGEREGLQYQYDDVSKELDDVERRLGRGGVIGGKLDDIERNTIAPALARIASIDAELAEIEKAKVANPALASSLEPRIQELKAERVAQDQLAHSKDKEIARKRKRYQKSVGAEHMTLAEEKALLEADKAERKLAEAKEAEAKETAQKMRPDQIVYPNPHPSGAVYPNPYPSGTVFSPGTGVSNPVDVNNSTCWENLEAVTPVSAFFSIGRADIEQTADTESEENKLYTILAAGVKKAVEELKTQGASRIRTVESTGFASQIPIGASKRKEMTNETLSFDRAKIAVDKFFAIAAYEAGSIDLKTPDFAEPVTQDVRVRGPKYDREEYRILKAQTKVTKAMIRKAAEELQKSKDVTPARGATIEETEKNLTACCSASAAALKFQPFQYMTLKVTGAKFRPERCTQPGPNGMPVGANPTQLEKKLPASAVSTEGAPITTPQINLNTGEAN